MIFLSKTFIIFFDIGFFNIIGIIVLLFTILLGIFKKEKDNRLDEGFIKINVIENYKLLWNIIKLPRIKVLALALLTMKVNMNNAYSL